MSFKLEKMDNIAFLRFYKKYRPLWDPDRKGSYTVKEECYKNLIKDIGKNDVTILDVKHKIRLLRSTYTDMRRKIKQKPNFKPTMAWFYYADSFLKCTSKDNCVESATSPEDIKLEIIEETDYINENGDFIFIEESAQDIASDIVYEVEVEAFDSVNVTSDSLTDENIEEPLQTDIETLAAADECCQDTNDGDNNEMKTKRKKSRKYFIDKDKEILFIFKLLKRFEALWNTRSLNYKSSRARSKALFEMLKMVDEFGLKDYTTSKLKKKIQTAKYAYAQELNKVRSSKDLYLPEKIWFPFADSFLRAHTSTDPVSKKKISKQTKPAAHETQNEKYLESGYNESEDNLTMSCINSP